MKKVLCITGLVAAAFTYNCVADSSIDQTNLNQADANDSQWLTHGKNYQETRHSPLKQVNTKTIQHLTLLTKTVLPDWRGVEATPLLIDGVLYVTGPWSKVYAIGAKSGEILWSYDPEVPGQSAINGCCDVVNRGLAAWDDKLYFGSFDGRLIALDRKTGKEVWQRQTVDQNKPYTITGAPRVVKGLVFIGNGGAEFGVRGYFSAYDAQTGEMKWRFYTVPGNPDDGFENKAMEKAADTWTGQWWKYGGGGTVWDSMAYDPELDLLYVGTGNGSPWDRHQRSPEGGDNLYLSSILAIKPESGTLVWHYQTTPGDSWDFTATQQMILAELEIDGSLRKVLMQAPKNGYFYVLDRTNGELISADAFTYMNWSTGVDKKTGRPVESDFARYSEVNAQIAPNYDGGHNWHPMAYNPSLGYVFLPGRDTVSFYGRDLNWKYNESGFGTGAGWNLATGNQDDKPDIYDKAAPAKKGFLKAWDPIAGKPAWTVSHQDFWNGGVLSTAGNLVFQGTSDGFLKAYDSRSGEEVFSYEVGVGILAPPITYELDGKQYITVAAGWGGGYGMKNILTDKLSSDLVLTFALNTSGNETTPVNVVYQENYVAFHRFSPGQSSVKPDPDWKKSATIFKQGERVFNTNCAVCHVIDNSRGGIAPNLLASHMIEKEVLPVVVLEGALQRRGMPSFAGKLNKNDVSALSHYLKTVQQETLANGLGAE